MATFMMLAASALNAAAATTGGDFIWLNTGVAVFAFGLFLLSLTEGR